MTADFDDIPAIALDWHRSGKGAAMATVVETWGSAPRPVGSQLAISGEGEIQGSVSGGCVEGAVVVEAIEALEEGGSRVLTYGVSDDEAFAVGLACGGTIRVMVEPVAEIGEDLLADLVAARAGAASCGLRGRYRDLGAAAGRAGRVGGAVPDGPVGLRGRRRSSPSTTRRCAW